MGTLFVDKLDPQSGTSLELGSSGDTVSVNTGATTNLAGNVTLGASGKTITVPAGATITNNGTQTGFGGTNTPRFLAYKASGYQGYGSSTTVKLVFSTEEHDSDSAYDTSSSRFTVPSGKGGVYVFGSRITVQDVGADQAAYLKGYKNGTGGTLLGYFVGHNMKSSTGNVSMQGTFVATLAAADYVEMYVTTPSTVGAGGAGLAYQFFYGYKLV